MLLDCQGRDRPCSKGLWAMQVLLFIVTVVVNLYDIIKGQRSGKETDAKTMILTNLNV